MQGWCRMVSSACLFCDCFFLLLFFLLRSRRVGLCRILFCFVLLYFVSSNGALGLFWEWLLGALFVAVLGAGKNKTDQKWFQKWSRFPGPTYIIVSSWWPQFRARFLDPILVPKRIQNVFQFWTKTGSKFGSSMGLISSNFFKSRNVRARRIDVMWLRGWLLGPSLDGKQARKLFKHAV